MTSIDAEPMDDPPQQRGPSPHAIAAQQEDDDAPLAREGAVDPQRLLRIAGVVREVLEEARRIRPEPGALEHLREVHRRIVDELKRSLPEKLWDELDDLTPDPDPRDATLEELGIAHAEILGWLEGLFQGTQLAIQLQAAAMMQERGRRPLPGQRPAEAEDRPDSRYL
jgi:hypothetical protein